ncbi:MAG TPA: hypothetical protein VHE33_13850 [Acidobacteriaceae bacterium]|nr:hypothetical protein [Acidobacteriaceae bacterium]
MKRLSLFAVQFLAAALVGSVCGPSLRAQSDIAITASVSHAFTIGTQTLGAGTYRFSQGSDAFLLSVINVKTGEQKLFTVLPEQHGDFAQQGYLRFRTVGESSVLSEIHFSGTDVFSAVVQKQKPERRLAKKSSAKDTVSVAQR